MGGAETEMGGAGSLCSRRAGVWVRGSAPTCSCDRYGPERKPLRGTGDARGGRGAKVKSIMPDLLGTMG